MIGKITLTQISKSTGEEEILAQEFNQTAAGFPAAMVNVLTGTGSNKVDDYKFRYFQLGTINYDLSTFDISADVPKQELVGNIWALRRQLRSMDYGGDSTLPVVTRSVYGLGARSWDNTYKIFYNFIDLPDNTTLLGEYYNNFQTYLDGSYLDKTHPQNAQASSTWVVGGTDKSWFTPENKGRVPLLVSAANGIKGPNFTTNPYAVQYNSNVSVDSIDSCIQHNYHYVSANGSVSKDWVSIDTNQTISLYCTTEYFASSNTAASGSTPVGGAIQFFNTTAKNVTGRDEPAESRVSVEYRYDYDTDSAGGAGRWYPPRIIEAKSGYERCKGESSDCLDDWESAYGIGVGGGDVSGNVYCISGALYTAADAAAGYTTRSGPGADCYDTSNSGFGPSGNFYRISASWNNVPDEVINFDNGEYSKADGQISLYPLLSSLSGVDGGTIVGHTSNHDVTPREVAYIANFQYERDVSASPNQTIHGESPSYITSEQSFVEIPEAYTTSLNENTTNVRLLLDEYLANGKTIKEVALFLKNPGGNTGVDNPFMSGYKVLNPPLQKNDEFSYIIDWEISVVDIDSI